MLIESNPGEYNLPTLVGMVLEIVGHHEPNMPITVRVIGLRNYDSEVYLDSNIPHVNLIADLIRQEGATCVIGMPRGEHENPEQPSVGFTRYFRERRITLAAKITSFVLFVVNGKVQMTQQKNLNL